MRFIIFSVVFTKEWKKIRNRKKYFSSAHKRSNSQFIHVQYITLGQNFPHEKVILTKTIRNKTILKPK